MELLGDRGGVVGGLGRMDPRVYQVGILSALLVYGTAWLDFDLSLGNALVIFAGALVTQFACTRIWNLPVFDPKSALISGLSLCLLLRTNSLAVALAAAVVAVASKFLLRWNGKHVFNPTNLSLVVILCTGLGWASPGQWGREAFLGFLVACLGGLVVNRAARSDVTYAFLGAYSSLVFGRALWLGDPLAIPMQQLQSGALLVFAFFMISDPKTTPDSRAGRILFASMVAACAAFVQFGLYQPNGLLWSLVCCAATVPVIDQLLPGLRYVWKGRVVKEQSVKERSVDQVPFATHTQGGSHETPRYVFHAGSGHGRLEQHRGRILRVLRCKGRYQTVQQGLGGGHRST